MYSKPSQASKTELYEKMVDCIQPSNVSAKTSIFVVSQGYMSLIKLNKNLLFHRKLGLQSQQSSSSFKFNFIFTLLLPYAETLLLPISIHACLISK